MENELKIEFGKENTFEIVLEQKEEIFIDVLIPFQDEEESKPDVSGDDLESSVEKTTLLEGKRSRKPTARLDVSVLTPSKKVVSIPQGRGKALGDIEHINQRLNHATTDTLSRLSRICFGRQGALKNAKKNLRLFQGFDFDHRSDGYQKNLKKLAKLKKDQLRSISELLCLQTVGRNSELAERILDFLMKPSARKTRKPSTIRTMKKRTTVSKRTKNSEKPVEPEPEPDETLLLNCQVQLDNVAHQSEPNLFNTPLPVEPTEEEPINESHNQTDQSSINLVIDENQRTDEDAKDPIMNNTNVETSF